MRIAVLGGAGLTGRAAVRNLVENKRVSEVLVVDVDREALEKLNRDVASDKIEIRCADVTDVETTSKIITGCDVMINAVQYYYNLYAMQAALKAGVNYIDHGGLYHMTLKQLELDNLFKSEGLIAVIGMGAQPGVTNAVAKHASEQLDEMTSILIRDGSVDLTENAPSFVVTWSIHTLFDELTMDAIVYEGGEFKKVPPLSRSEIIDFPEPVGRLETYVTLHSEIATLPRSFREKGLMRNDWMEGSSEIKTMKILADMGFGTNQEMEVEGVKINPRKILIALLREKGLIGYPEGITPNDWEITRVIVEGKRLGRKIRKTYDITFPPNKEWRMSCAQIGVGIPSSTVATMIAEGEIREKGVKPPEQVIPPNRLFEEIGRKGIKIVENIVETIN